MRSKLMTLLTVIGAITVLVLAANTVALATTGRAILAGKVNYTGNMTSLVRTTPGVALQVKTKSAANSPFAVNGKGKVANLNADLVDGLDSSTMLNKTYLFQKFIEPTGVRTEITFTTSVLPAGNYLVDVAGWLYGPTTGDGVECFVADLGFNQLRETWMPVNPDGFYTISIGGLLRLTTPQALSFRCDGPDANYRSYVGNPVQISLTKVGSLTVGTTSAATRQTGRVAASRR